MLMNMGGVGEAALRYKYNLEYAKNPDDSGYMNSDIPGSSSNQQSSNQQSSNPSPNPQYNPTTGISSVEIVKTVKDAFTSGVERLLSELKKIKTYIESVKKNTNEEVKETQKSGSKIGELVSIMKNAFSSKGAQNKQQDAIPANDNDDKSSFDQASSNIESKPDIPSGDGSEKSNPLEGILKIFKEMEPIISVAEIALEALEGCIEFVAAEIVPIIAGIGAAIAAVVAGFAAFTQIQKHLPEIKKFFEGIGSSIMDFIKSIGNFWKNLFHHNDKTSNQENKSQNSNNFDFGIQKIWDETIGKMFKDFNPLELMGNITKSFMDWFKGLTDSFPKNIGDLINLIKSIGGAFVDGYKHGDKPTPKDPKDDDKNYYTDDHGKRQKRIDTTDIAPGGKYYNASKSAGAATRQAVDSTGKVIKAGETALGGVFKRNNLGNMRKPGSAEYQTFNSPEEGLVNVAKQLKVYDDKHGRNNLREITYNWAPKSDRTARTPNDPEAYAKIISKETGIKLNQKVDLHDPATVAKIMHAMGKVEHGKSPYTEDQIRKVLEANKDKWAKPIDHKASKYDGEYVPDHDKSGGLYKADGTLAPNKTDAAAKAQNLKRASDQEASHVTVNAPTVNNTTHHHTKKKDTPKPAAKPSAQNPNDPSHVQPGFRP